MKAWPFFLLCLSSAAAAAPDRATPGARASVSFPAAPGGFRGGLEVELTAEHFAKFVNLFDLDRLQAVSGAGWAPGADNPTVLDDYLRDNSLALGSLTPELRAELTRGLHLVSGLEPAPVASRPAALPAAPPLLRRPTIEPYAWPKSEASYHAVLHAGLPSAALPPPEATAADLGAGSVERAGLILPRRLDWQELYRRWAALPIAVKSEQVHWELLGPGRKAELVLGILSQRPAGTDSRDLLRLKPDLSPVLTALFRKLAWAPDDAGVIEFTYAPEVRVNSPAELYEDTLALARVAGVESKVLRPATSRLRGVSFHTHVSRAGANFDSWLPLFNVRLLVERIHAGQVTDLRGHSQYVFFEDVTRKGLLRRKAADHFERRTQIRPLAEEIAELTELAGMEPAAAAAKLEGEIKALLDPSTFRRVLRHNSEFAAVLSPWLSPAQRQAAATYQRRLETLVLEAHGDRLWRRLPALLRSPRPDLQEAAHQALLTNEPTAGFWRAVPGLVADERVPSYLVDEIFLRHAVPGELAPALLRSLLARPPAELARALIPFVHLWRAPDPAAKEYFFRLLAVEGESDRQFGLLRDLGPGLLEPADAERLLTIAEARGPEVKAAAASYAIAHDFDSSRAWEQARALLAERDFAQDPRENLFLALEISDRWPDDIKAAVLTLARDGEIPSDHHLLAALAEQDPGRFARFLEEQIRRPAGSHELVLHFLRRQPNLPPALFRTLGDAFTGWTMRERIAVLKVLIARDDVPSDVRRDLLPESIAGLENSSARIQALQERAHFDPECEALYANLKRSIE